MTRLPGETDCGVDPPPMAGVQGGWILGLVRGEPVGSGGEGRRGM